jgi:2-polyprenyl-3-methyl-5-hydroxy-6-metoxy-1,4-benzoquinol methylase
MLGDEISEKVNAFLGQRSSIKLLEAGCGSMSYFKFAPSVVSTGIDISREQLERNAVIQEKIQGDLQTYPLPQDTFDVVVCWDVIEHLPRPQQALKNLFQTLKPGGYFILGFPNVASFKGLLTKFTPLWFHEAFYRFMKYQSHPFKAYLRFAILPGRVIAFAHQNGLEVVYQRMIEGKMTRRFRERFWVARATFGVVDFLARLVTLGKLQSMYWDSCALVLHKPVSTQSVRAA